VMDFTRSGRIHIQSFCYRRSMDQRERITQSIQKLINSHAQHSNTAQTTTQPKLITKNSTFCSYVTRWLACSPSPTKAKQDQARLPYTYTINQLTWKQKGTATLSIPSRKTPLALCDAALNTACKNRRKEPISFATFPEYCSRSSSLSCAFGADVPMRLTFCVQLTPAL
jgi:hypothetical protein